jgi:hypothetical protein
MMTGQAECGSNPVRGPVTPANVDISSSGGLHVEDGPESVEQSGEHRRLYITGMEIVFMAFKQDPNFLLSERLTGVPGRYLDKFNSLALTVANHDTS